MAILLNNRDKNIADFQNKKYQVLITNPAVTRFGNDFTCSSYCIYFSNHFNLEHRIQSEDRLHRIGQVNKVTYIDLVTEDSIETKILKVLEKKHSVGAEILKDEWEEWFK
jgi:SNF2 family DNA or RNA helicase